MLASIQLFFKKYPWALYGLICLFSFFIAVFYISYILITLILKPFISNYISEIIAVVGASIIVLWFIFRVVTSGFYYLPHSSNSGNSGCIGRTGNYSEIC